MNEGPPDFSRGRIDFSQAHFLDHNILHCHGLPGGRRRHLRYRWEYHYKDLILRNLRCRLNLHSPATFWRGTGAEARRFVGCRICLKMLSK